MGILSTGISMSGVSKKLLTISFFAGFFGMLIAALLILMFLHEFVFSGIIAALPAYLALYYLVPAFQKELKGNSDFLRASLLRFYLGVAGGFVFAVFVTIIVLGSKF